MNYRYTDTRLRRADGFGRQFFEAVPALNNDSVQLEYQQKYVSKLVSVACNYDNVLYQIDNESYLPHEVAAYWAAWIQQETEYEVYVADSRRYHPPSFEQSVFQDAGHPETLVPVNRPDLFGYLDISQNGGHVGQTPISSGTATRSTQSHRGRSITSSCTASTGRRANTFGLDEPIPMPRPPRNSGAPCLAERPQ